MSKKHLTYSNCHILYDSSVIDSPDPMLFDPKWLHAHGETEQIKTGRGDAWLINYQEHDWVLRRYRRGGMVAKFNKKYYLGWCLEATRAWKEWHLLYAMHELGLPVPRPVAATVCWSYSRLVPVYQAGILINKIPGAETLADKLKKDSLSETEWNAVGRCIRKFHDASVFHADLNADNILFDENQKIYLIDFDRGEFRQSNHWKNSNLDRLNRSLTKLMYLNARFYYAASCWNYLLNAYKNG
ncbi:MAG: 3-deoxy-D-manno-octulosonic acid kinase [Gammaproteobacteria bacterium]|nr:3-deoxy-D-manno-octulosonic acid kinase [Gammaproteobacteria bacterium]